MYILLMYTIMSPHSNHWMFYSSNATFSVCGPWTLTQGDLILPWNPQFLEKPSPKAGITVISGKTLQNTVDDMYIHIVTCINIRKMSCNDVDICMIIFDGLLKIYFIRSCFIATMLWPRWKKSCVKGKERCADSRFRLGVGACCLEKYRIIGII